MARQTKRTGRDSDPRRTIPLNSAAWRKLRELILDDEPLCRYCWEAGQVSRATDVDHISGDPSDNSRENLQGLCHECHSTKTARDHGKRVSLGCDVNGYPLDPDHPWARVCRDLEKSLETGADRPPGNSSFNAKGKDHDTPPTF